MTKLTELKNLRKENLEKNFYDHEIRGYDHYVFINKKGRAELVIDNHWIKDPIRNAVSRFNEQLDEIDRLLIKDFSFEELEKVV